MSSVFLKHGALYSDLYKSPYYSSIHQTISSGKAGCGLAIFVHKSLTYSVRKDLSTNSEDIEALCTEIVNAERTKTYYSKTSE